MGMETREYVIECACGRRWEIPLSGLFGSLYCGCGRRYYNIHTKPTFGFNIEEAINE